MPRIIRGTEEVLAIPSLVEALGDELRSSRETGQPIIDEQRFPDTNAIRSTVIWDEWARLTDEQRSSTILQAYEVVEGKPFRDRIALAVGLTFPEAYEAGLLPYCVVPLLRSGDTVTAEQCINAMRAEGASLLFDSGKPQLRFPSEQQANASKNRLTDALPGSGPVWAVVQEVGRISQISGTSQ